MIYDSDTITYLIRLIRYDTKIYGNDTIFFRQTAQESKKMVGGDTFEESFGDWWTPLTAIALAGVLACHQN